MAENNRKIEEAQRKLVSCLNFRQVAIHNIDCYQEFAVVQVQ